MTFLIIKSLFAFSHRIGTVSVGKMRNGQTRRSDPFDPDSMFKVDAVRFSRRLRTKSAYSLPGRLSVPARQLVLSLGISLLREKRSPPGAPSTVNVPPRDVVLLFVLLPPSSSYSKYDENERCFSSFLMFHRFESSLLLFQREHDKSEKRLEFIHFIYIYLRLKTMIIII